MKKFLLRAFLPVAVLFLASTSKAQTTGIYESYAILSINGAANTYYDMNAVTANTDFQGANLGSFTSANSLVVVGGQNKTFKCSGGDVTGGNLYYRVWSTSAGASGTFTSVGMGFVSNDAGGCGGNQTWEGTSGTTNVLTGLPAGNYTIEVYSDAPGFPSTAFSNNGGANYRATFTYCGPTSGALPVGNYAIPGCFPTVAAAVTYINANGVSGTGTVQFDVAAGYTETAPAGGISITATGTATTAIVFKKSGTGANPTITANSTLTAGSLNDAIFKIIGGDYITIDGFTMLENANTTTTAASNNMTEFGVALFYATTTNGCQNITVKNCTIDLNRTYQNTFGIYANSTHSATAVTTAATATGVTGGNHNLTITGNTITDVNQGIVVIGPTAAADNNDNIVIGGSVGNANTITNFGTTGTFSSYANVSGTVNGILVRNSKNTTISNNAITSSVGGVTSGTLNGIQITAASNAPTGTFTNNINNNSISLRSGVASGAINGINFPSGSSTSTSTLNINANDFNNFGHTVAGTGTISFIITNGTDFVKNINNNTFSNVSVNTTGSVTFINHGASMIINATHTISNNAIVTAFAKTGAGGTVTGLTSGTSSVNGSNSVMTNNNFSNITVTGATAITGISNSDGSGSSPNRTVTGNVFNNWTGGTSAIIGMSFSYIGATSSISNNTITNLTGQASITGITISNTFAGGNPLNIANNTITNLVSNVTGGAVVGITCSSASPLVNISNNNINTISSIGAVSVQGIVVSGSTSTNVFLNKVYNLESNNASGTVNGIAVSGGTLNVIYNNIIGDLRTPAANAANPLNGINITGGTTVNVYHNTVRLAGTSSGALFGSSAVSVSTTPNVTLRNNIFINNSGFAGTGIATAYRRSSTTLTTYNASSDNNLFYAGTPGANNVIFYDGTTGRQTLADYKTFLATRDQASQTEDVTFQSTTGSDANFLRIAAGTTSYAESGAVLLTTPNINTDYWGITRPFTSPVNGGTGVDIGASEFDGIPSLVNCVAPVDQATAYVAGAVTSNSAAATFTVAASAPTGYLVIGSQGALTGSPVDGTSYIAGASIGNGAVIQSSASTSINATGLPSNTVGTITIYSYNSGSCAGGPKYNLVSPLVGTNTTCAGAPTLPVSNSIISTGFTTNWTATVGGNAFPLTYTVEVTTDAAYTTPIAGSPFTTTATSLAISGLSPQTNYYWRVKANNTVCDSAYLNAGLVTTECTAVTTFPSVEPFATYLPTTCWKEGDLGDLTAGPTTIGSAVSDWISDDYLNNVANGLSAKMNIDTASGSEWIISPYYTIPTTGYRVKYNVGATQFGATTAPTTAWEADDFVELLVSTSNTNWTVLKTYNNSNVPSNLGQIDNSDLSAYSGQTVHFAFRAFEGASNGSADIDFFVDNFTVEVTPVAITASATVDPICSGDSTTLSVSSANTNYTYTWSPATGLSATTGSSVTANPTSTTTYTINAVDGSMVNSTTITVTVNPAPAAITITPATATVCQDVITPLVVSGGSFLTSITSGSGALTTTAASTAAGLGPNPMQSYYGGAKQQMLYTATELTALGFTAGTIINSIAFEMSAVEARTLQNYEISMQNSALTSFTSTSFVTSGFTNVKAAGNVTPTVGVNTIVLDSPFAWNGTSSLLVQISFSNNDAGGTGTNTAKYDTTSFASTLFYRVDNTSAATVASAATASFSAYSSRNKVTFGLLPPAVTWSPQTDLYTDATASTAYTGQNLTTVYHKGATNTYVATATLGSCSKTATATVTVNPTITTTFNQVAPICSGDTFTLPTTSLEGVTGTWSPAINNTTTTAYTFTPTAGQCATTAAMTVTVGGTSTWSGSPAVWSPAAPTSIDGAIILANYSEATNLNACTLTIDNNAVVAIPSGINVNLQGAINVVSGSFALANTANLNQVRDVNNSGNISVTCTTTPLKRLDYVLWSAPVTGQQLQSFSPGTLSNRFYTYNPSTDFYEVVASPSTTNFDEGTGYLIRVPNGHPTTATPLSRTFTGVPNNGNLSISVSNGTWNAIGNPYPSTIDADEFITTNSLTDPLYFWRKENGATGTAYATYTLAGGAGTASNATSTVMTPDGTIAVGQGFLAKATSTSFSLTNAMRNGDTSTQFFRTNTIDRSRVWLNLFKNELFVNQTMVAYMPSATNGIDAAIDGRFFETNIATQLSSIINGEEYAVQGRAPFMASDIVSLGFKAETEGNYSIAIDHSDGIFANDQEVFLKDNLTNTVHNLSNGIYNFASTAGNFNTRFEIVYQSTLATENPVLNENTVIVFKKNQDIVVNTGSIKMKNVQIYDIQGRLLIEQKDINATTTKLEVGTTNQVLIVKVTSNDNVVVTKKVIN